MVSTRVSKSTKNSGSVYAPKALQPSSATKATKIKRRVTPATQANQRAERTAAVTSLSQHQSALPRSHSTMPLGDGTFALDQSSRKCKNRSPLPPHQPSASSSVSAVGDSQEAPSPASKSFDVDDPGYITATTVTADSDYDEDSDYLPLDQRLARRARLVPPAPACVLTINHGRMRSYAQPVAQQSQPPALGPTLAELRARNDLPEEIERWLALSTATSLYDDHQRLPSRFAGTSPHLFTSSPLACHLSASTLLSASPRPTLYPGYSDSLFSATIELHTPAAPFHGFPKPEKRRKKQSVQTALKQPRVAGPSRLEVKNMGPFDSDRAPKGRIAK